MVARIFAVLAAVFLVGAVSIFALTPVGLTLAQGLLQLDRGAVDWAQAHSAAWLWSSIETPFLVRPLWLIPACLGVVCAGLAGSFNLGKSTNTRRRRS